jgi:geranylgeranyl diphosphate synthase type I
MAVELVHTALLMHDDFMDQDDIRRGRPTTHKYFEEGDIHHGESMAVNVGDAVLLLGYQLLNASGYEAEKIILAERQLLRGVVNTAYGQAYDVCLDKYNDWNEDDVIALHKAKTAIYTYENPLFVGAILAGLKGEVFEILHDYSVDGGVAFQLQDDVLGVYGNPEKTGKSANSDLLQGKVTLLILKALENGTEEQRQIIKKVWGKRKAKNSDIEMAKKAIKESGSHSYSMDVSREYAKKAVETAEKLRQLNLNEEAIDYIRGIAEYMVHREV